ncbi:TPA: hypothetical protein ACX6RU_003783 [Photobacterium damselae]
MKRITIVFFVFLIVLYACHNTKNVQNLYDSLSTVREYATVLKKNNLVINDNELNSKENKSELEVRIYDEMKKNNIYRIIYRNNSKVESIAYDVDYFMSFFTGNKSYVYSSDGYTEELQVDSIDEFLEDFDPEVDGKYFAVCEKLGRKNWFYCENNH